MRCSLGNWERIEEIFLAAVELPVSDRAAYLDAACAGDAALRAELEALLRADAGGPSLLAAVRRETRSLLERLAGEPAPDN